MWSCWHTTSCLVPAVTVIRYSSEFPHYKCYEAQQSTIKVETPGSTLYCACITIVVRFFNVENRTFCGAVTAVTNTVPCTMYE